MILIGTGGNLPSIFGPPEQGPPQALRLLQALGVTLVQCSPLYGAKAVPVSQQPDYVNAVARIETSLRPEALLATMLSVELAFGRVRGRVNAARSLDLDLLAYDDICREEDIILPHPRLHERAFVLAPLCDIAPDWRHPRLGRTARELFEALPKPYGVWRL